MSIAQWSTTAANNATAADNINWAEGQAPSTVNNSARQEMADVANWYRNTAEFIDRDDNAAFSSAAQIKFTGTDLTGTYKVGRRILTTSSTPGTLHGRITASSFSTDTTVTISFDSTAVLSNEAISDVQVGIISGSTNSSVHVEAIDGMPAFTASKQGALLLQNDDDDGYTLLTSQGSTGLVLTSNGADALPSFQAVSGAILSSQTASASATIEFITNFATAGKDVVFRIKNLILATDAEGLNIQVSLDGGSTWKAADYDQTNEQIAADGADKSGTAAANAVFKLIRTGGTNPGIGNASGEGAKLVLEISDPSNTALFKQMHWAGSYMDSGGFSNRILGNGSYKGATSAITGIRFLASSGNITSGRFDMFSI